ncbi:MAG: hypothetical protein ACYTEP_08345 [Planctomycetota bacterium]|jgi:hypothetical protein
MKYLTLTLLSGALAFASCSGEAEDSDDTADQVEETVLSESDAAAEAATDITDEASAGSALEDLEKQLND